MAFSRFQFRLSTLLWITLAVACWFGGMRAERWRAELTERWRAKHEQPGAPPWPSNKYYYIFHGPLPDEAAR
jgi:hypothetical protein